MLASVDYKMWWREEKIFPNGDGTYTGIWAQSGDCTFSGLAFMTSENPDDGDTTYAVSDDSGVGGPTCGHALGPGKHSFLMQNPSDVKPSDDILALTCHGVTRKTGASACTFRTGVRLSGNELFGGSNTLSTGYIDWGSGRFPLKPGTGPPTDKWELATVNAVEGIIESVTTGTGPQEQRCTQFYITVEYVIMPALPPALLSGFKKRQRAQNHLVYMPPEFFIAKRYKKPPIAAAAPQPFFSDRAKRRKTQAVYPEPGGGFYYVRARVKALPFGAAPPATPGVFTQPQRIFLNRRGPSINVRGRG